MYEHPHGASSWELESVAKMRGHENVYEVNLHMCALDMKVSACQDDEGVFKPTRVLTNSRAIAESISRRCQGGHRHHHLLGGKAWEAAIHPPKFCQALLRGIHIEKEARKKMYANVACYSLGPEDLHDSNSEHEIAQQHTSPIEGELGPKLVFAAREVFDESDEKWKSLKIFDEMGVYDRVQIDKVSWLPGTKIIGTRWVDVDKTRTQEAYVPQVRSRFVSKEFAHGGAREDLFAGMPPLMTLKLLLALFASSEGGICLETAEL